MRGAAELTVKKAPLRLVWTIGLVEPQLGEGVAFGNLGVVRDLADSQMVVSQDLISTLLVNLVVTHPGAPAHQRLLVSPT
jgi:hypothetical protein